MSAIAAVKSSRSDATPFKVDLMIITPDMAREWLKRNIADNRSIKPRLVEQLARDIKAGKFILNGDPIRFTELGELIDGQHRLHACVRADTAFQSLVVQGVPRRAIGTIDIGAKRTFGDALTVGYGKVSGKNFIAAAAGLIAREIFARKAKRGNHPFTGDRISWGELDYVFRNKLHELVELEPLARKSNELIPAGMGLWLLHKFASINRAQALKFWEQVSTGENLERGDPAYALRQRMIRRDQARDRNYRMKLAAYVLKAWNAFRKNEKVHLLRWDIDEDFPEAK